MNTHAAHLAAVLKKIKENEDNLENAILPHGVLLRIVDTMENLKHGTWHLFSKGVLKIDYLIETFMAFKPNDLGNSHIHGIVHDHVPILGTYVYLGKTNNVAK